MNLIFSPSAILFQFSCYLEECQQKSKSQQERRDHCIKDHKFPHDFRFDKVSIRKTSVNEDDDVMDTSETSMKQKPVPVFHFGHKAQKTFNTNKSKRKTDPLESLNIDMKAALPEVWEHVMNLIKSFQHLLFNSIYPVVLQNSETKKT